jgi:hypothetical protein
VNFFHHSPSKSHDFGFRTRPPIMRYRKFKIKKMILIFNFI